MGDEEEVVGDEAEVEVGDGAEDTVDTGEEVVEDISLPTTIEATMEITNNPTIITTRGSHSIPSNISTTSLGLVLMEVRERPAIIKYNSFSNWCFPSFS